MLTGRTHTAGVIGSPIRHSLSPVMFNAAFVAAGMDWAYLAFEVGEGKAVGAMEAMRTLGLEGVSVTMPHKGAVLPALDTVSEDAALLGAVNCVTRRGGSLHGDNTDGPGFLDALRIDEGIEIESHACVVVGAGGAGRAVARALAQAGARVTIVNRSAPAAERAALLAGNSARVGGFADLAEASLVVNATPLGMGLGSDPGGRLEPLPFDVTLLAPGQVVFDLVYHPAPTPLLVAATAQGLRSVPGVGMLVHQAAHAFRHWTGEEPPLVAMRLAASTVLSERRAG